MIHCEYQIVCWLVVKGVGNSKWKTYLSKNEGRRDFQIDLAISLMNYGLALDWDGGATRPDYVRDNIVPCDCNVCFFCEHGLAGVINRVAPRGERGRPCCTTSVVVAR